MSTADFEGLTIMIVFNNNSSFTMQMNAYCFNLPALPNNLKSIYHDKQFKPGQTTKTS